MRWRRRLIAQKWTFAYRRGPSRLGILREIGELIVRIAQEKRSWGYTRIQRALANLNHGVGRGTITDVLKHNPLTRGPSAANVHRGQSWSFLKAHWKVLAASDFLTVEVWTGGAGDSLLFV